MRILIILTMLTLVSCDSVSAGDRAVDEYAKLTRIGHAAISARCQSAKKIAGAYFAEGKADDYDFWRARVTDDCRKALKRLQQSQVESGRQCPICQGSSHQQPDIGERTRE